MGLSPQEIEKKIKKSQTKSKKEIIQKVKKKLDKK